MLNQSGKLRSGHEFLLGSQRRKSPGRKDNNRQSARESARYFWSTKLALKNELLDALHVERLALIIFKDDQSDRKILKGEAALGLVHNTTVQLVQFISDCPEHLSHSLILLPKTGDTAYFLAPVPRDSQFN